MRGAPVNARLRTGSYTRRLTLPARQGARHASGGFVRPMHRREEMGGAGRRRTVEAVVARRMHRELEADLMPELVCGGRADALAEAAHQLRARLRAAIEVVAAGGGHLRVEEHVDVHAAARGPGKRDTGGAESHAVNWTRSVRRVLDDEVPLARAALGKRDVEAVERVAQGGERRALDR